MNGEDSSVIKRSDQHPAVCGFPVGVVCLCSLLPSCEWAAGVIHCSSSNVPHHTGQFTKVLPSCVG